MYKPRPRAGSRLRTRSRSSVIWNCETSLPSFAPNDRPLVTVPRVARVCSTQHSQGIPGIEARLLDDKDHGANISAASWSGSDPDSARPGPRPWTYVRSQCTCFSPDLFSSLPFISRANAFQPSFSPPPLFSGHLFSVFLLPSLLSSPSLFINFLLYSTLSLSSLAHR